MSGRLVYWRASLSANSFASLPPVEKNALLIDLGPSLMSFSASRTMAIVPCLPETWSTSPSCLVAAAMMRGWQ